MKFEIRQSGIFTVFAVSSILIMVFLLSPSLLAGAMLPPRPTPLPSTPTPPASVKITNSSEGGHIELNVHPVQSGLWAIVQWQDTTGNWHNVEGWRSSLKQSSVRWWVSPVDFRTGPFRWVIYQPQDGKQLDSSPSFYLPDAVEYEVVVTLLPKP